MRNVTLVLLEAASLLLVAWAVYAFLEVVKP